MSLLAEGLKSAARRSPQGHICDVWCNEHWRLHNHSHYQFLRIFNLVLIQVWCCQWSFQADLWLRSKADCLRAVHGLRTRQEGRGLAALWESFGRKEMSLHKNRNGENGRTWLELFASATPKFFEICLCFGKTWRECQIWAIPIPPKVPYFTACSSESRTESFEIYIYIYICVYIYIYWSHTKSNII